MRRARFVLFLICQFGSVASPAVLDAQLESSVELGLSRLRQANIPESSALSGGATVDVLGERSQLRATLLASRQTESRWTSQAALFGSIIGKSPSPWWQLDAAATNYAQTSALPTTSVEGAARLRTGSGPHGAAVGIGAGASATGARTGGVQRALGDAWWNLDRERFVASFGWTHANAPELSTPGSIAYTDLSGGWRHEAGALSLGLSGGLRFQSTGGPDTDSWQLVDASVWFAPHAAFVVTAGRTLADIVRGTPRTSWVGASIRWSPNRHVSLGPRAIPDRSLPRLTVTRVDTQRVSLEITATNAARVELMADFTDWQPVLLERATQAAPWRIERPITAGLHRVSIRVDGGAWIAPANLPRADAAGEAGVGLLTIP
jgi:hypothetical protein